MRSDPPHWRDAEAPAPTQEKNIRIVLVLLRYIPLIGHVYILQYLRYNPHIAVICGICFSLAMLALLHKTARAVTRLAEGEQTEVRRTVVSSNTNS